MHHIEDEKNTFESSLDKTMPVQIFTPGKFLAACLYQKLKYYVFNFGAVRVKLRHPEFIRAILARRSHFHAPLVMNERQWRGPK